MDITNLVIVKPIVGFKIAMARDKANMIGIMRKKIKIRDSSMMNKVNLKMIAIIAIVEISMKIIGIYHNYKMNIKIFNTKTSTDILTKDNTITSSTDLLIKCKKLPNNIQDTKNVIQVTI